MIPEKRAQRREVLDPKRPEEEGPRWICDGPQIFYTVGQTFFKSRTDFYMNITFCDRKPWFFASSTKNHDVNTDNEYRPHETQATWVSCGQLCGVSQKAILIQGLHIRLHIQARSSIFRRNQNQRFLKDLLGSLIICLGVVFDFKVLVKNIFLDSSTQNHAEPLWN